MMRMTIPSWTSPCLLVPKSDNTPGFCSNFHKVNCVTKSDCFPFPRIEDCIDQVGKAKFVILMGYWQGPRGRETVQHWLHPQTCILIQSCLSVISNAPTFQCLMNRVVGDLEGCPVYLDDVVIYSDDWDVHLDRTEKLFDRLPHTHLTVNLAKCEFANAAHCFCWNFSTVVAPFTNLLKASTSWITLLLKRVSVLALGLLLCSRIITHWLS